MNTDWIPSVWTDTFYDMLEDEIEYSDSWTFQFNYGLKEKLTKEEKRRGWRIYCYRAHGKFRCDSCARQWPSARAVVLFHYRLRGGQNKGTVVMRPFGQACRRCCEGFQLPGFSPEEVEQVLLNLFHKIKKNCYGEEVDEEESGSDCSEKVWTKPHESSLCEACVQGICCQDD